MLKRKTFKEVDIVLKKKKKPKTKEQQHAHFKSLTSCAPIEGNIV